MGFALDGHAQRIIGLSAEYNDTFRSWDIIPEDEDMELGSLELSWPYNDGWNKWEYTIGDRSGNIRQKWINDPHHWEIIEGGYVVAIKNQWRGDLSNWKITCDDFTIIFKSRYNNIVDEWQSNTDHHGVFDIYTDFEGDPRDWIVIDDLDENVPKAMKLAMLFITAYYSAPHR